MRELVHGFKKGDRVQLHPATSHWMQGDRYGEVLGFGRGRLYTSKGCFRPILVKLDKSGRIERMHPENIAEVMS